jgi:hypothetical protein
MTALLVGWRMRRHGFNYPVYRVHAPTRVLGPGVPDDAVPDDLVVGNRGAAARVVQPNSHCLTLEYAGNWYRDAELRRRPGKTHDNRGGT